MWLYIYTNLCSTYEPKRKLPPRGPFGKESSNEEIDGVVVTDKSFTVISSWYDNISWSGDRECAD